MKRLPIAQTSPKQTSSSTNNAQNRLRSLEEHKDANLDHDSDAFLDKQKALKYWKKDEQQRQWHILQINAKKDLPKAIKEAQHNVLKCLNLSSYPTLEDIDVSSCPHLEALNVSKCKHLKSLNAAGTQITTLDISDCQEMKRKILSDGDFTCAYGDDIITLDFSNCKKLKTLHAPTCPNLKSLNLKGCIHLGKIDFRSGSVKMFEKIDLGETMKELQDEYEAKNNAHTTTEDLWEEMGIGLHVKRIKRGSFANQKLVFFPQIEESALSKKEIGAFNFSTCRNLEKLDVAGCITLRLLDVSGTKIAKLNISGCTALRLLNISKTKITQLAPAGYTKLQTIYAYATPIKKLDLSMCKKLLSLNVHNTQIKTLESLTTKDLQALNVAWCPNLAIGLPKFTNLVTLNIMGTDTQP